MIREIELCRLKKNAGQIDGLPANPRKPFTAAEVSRMVRSVEEDPEFLEANPLVVVPCGEDYVVLAGNLRLEALRKLKRKTATCDVCEGLSVRKMKEFVLKDNVHFGRWNYDCLANEWDDLPLYDMGVDVPQVDEDESGEGSRELDAESYGEEMTLVFRVPPEGAEYVKSQVRGDLKSEIMERLEKYGEN